MNLRFHRLGENFAEALRRHVGEACNGTNGRGEEGEARNGYVGIFFEKTQGAHPYAYLQTRPGNPLWAARRYVYHCTSCV